MATIEIGGRHLDVAEATIGFWKRFRKFGDEATKLENEEAANKVVSFFKELVGHNEGVTTEFLEDNLPLRAASLHLKFAQLLDAAGFSQKEKPAGEPAAQ